MANIFTWSHNDSELFGLILHDSPNFNILQPGHIDVKSFKLRTIDPQEKYNSDKAPVVEDDDASVGVGGIVSELEQLNVSRD